MKGKSTTLKSKGSKFINFLSIFEELQQVDFILFLSDLLPGFQMKTEKTCISNQTLDQMQIP